MIVKTSGRKFSSKSFTRTRKKYFYDVLTIFFCLPKFFVRKFSRGSKVFFLPEWNFFSEVEKFLLGKIFLSTKLFCRSGHVIKIFFPVGKKKSLTMIQRSANFSVVTKFFCTEIFSRQHFFFCGTKIFPGLTFFSVGPRFFCLYVSFFSWARISRHGYRVIKNFFWACVKKKLIQTAIRWSSKFCVHGKNFRYR